ncbi:uncharacterized protein CcaverHIS019_0505680 [Cutaneotrichosporon cavernicola]|uniref:Uncharacterized protein n=1 Tax=Cutaneotrichosporon cavernicola TaxID=279322 RepID=A0AA48QX23_9TREE|nr:uncharacterized protein CcaverHIS019_0505680 [Cutaneotrichosporon cavernicola]BEI92940.1 hypothetical protein CcaverHIS019_0505680 [Cutaneotrichosporon cavernicola]BEJ00716.1 hypothetical protein CcaverHIS631_0505730 [Cutaneotrichosporon cavernicola]BEJ08483.1 hypothetical protein CcaverHIS641_0505770 [Cutaneotrichosporon cavernicola]
MTIIPPGAKLAPVDLPPPPPAADPREPEGTRRVSRTPGRAKSPYSSRANSPTRPRAESGSPPPLLAPKPRNASGQGSISKHGSVHLSRPSSPSSIHSSGSAIFERDIEMPAAQSLSTLGHKGSRVFHHPHGSTLEHTVPAVLDDAVEALTASGPDSIGELEIEAPASTTGAARSGSASLSPALRSRVASMPLSASRSPSPESSPHPPHAPPLSLIAAALAPHIQSKSPTTSPTAVDTLQSMPDSPTQMYHGKHRPAPLRHLSTGPQLPGGWAFTDEDSTGATAIRSESTSGALTPMPTALPSHLTPTKEKRRVSFISYNDLLLSVPTAVTSLDDITTGNHAPDHLPGTVSPSVPSRSPVMAASPSCLSGPVVPDMLRPLGGSILEGEWQREGLGKGLEQRLEDLAFNDKHVTPEQKA